MRHGVQVLGPDCWQDRQFYPFINRAGIPDVVRPSVNRDIVAAGRQTRGKLFREGFEPAVIGWNAAGSKDSQFHEVAIIDYARRTRGAALRPGRYRMNNLLTQLTDQLP